MRFQMLILLKYSIIKKADLSILEKFNQNTIWMTRKLKVRF
jgi:hypothetical protein